MTTPNKFFEKLYQENDRFAPHLGEVNFKEFSERELKFLKILSIFTKYKHLLRPYLTNYKVNENEQKTYIEAYRSALAYKEYIDYERSTEELNENFVEMYYIIGLTFVGSWLYYVYKRPAGAPLGRESFYSLLYGLVAGLSYYQYRKSDYKVMLSRTYVSLSNRLNEYPEFKYGTTNPNLYGNRVDDDDY